MKTEAKENDVCVSELVQPSWNDSLRAMSNSLSSYVYVFLSLSLLLISYNI